MDQSGFGESNGETLRGGVYWPDGGYVTDPALSSQNLADAARQHRADFRLGVEVVGILKEGGRVGVRLADGEIHAGGDQCCRAGLPSSMKWQVSPMR